MAPEAHVIEIASHIKCVIDITTSIGLGNRLVAKRASRPGGHSCHARVRVQFFVVGIFVTSHAEFARVPRGPIA
jgi:hypothetical protein